MSLRAATRLPGVYDIKQISGLPQSEVNDIYEDSDGFLWIASLDGLYRYDGYKYKEYALKRDSDRVNSNMIFSICEDSGGNIWVSTYGKGLYKINPENDKITAYNTDELLPDYDGAFDISTFQIDRDDNIWASSWRAVVKIQLDKEHDFKIKRCSIYPISDEQIKKRDFVNKIHIDKLGNIWVGSNQSLRMVRGEQDGEMLYDTYNVAAQDIDDYGDSSIVAVASNVAILRRDSVGGYALEVAKHLDRNAIRVAAASESEMWLGSRDGFRRLWLDEGGVWRITNFFNKDNLPFEITTCAVSSIVCSTQGVVWIGTRGGGIVSINEKSKHFTNYPQDLINSRRIPRILTKAIFEDRDENLWIGTEHDGVVFQRKGSVYGSDYQFIDVNKIDNRAYAFEQSSDDIVWVGTCYPQGLVAYNNKSLKPITQSQYNLQLGFVFTLKMSDVSTLWAGTYNNGLWRLEIDSGGQIRGYRHFNTTNSSISSNIIRSLLIAPDGDLWIATDVGINRLERSSLHDADPDFLTTPKGGSKLNMLKHYTLQLAQHSSGDMLFGTMGGGLGRYNFESDSLSFITTEDGLANNSVKSIVEEPSNPDKVWLSTNRGLSKVDLTTNSIVNYDSDDGIIDTEFSEICALSRANGQLIFGNRAGVVGFDPQRITTSGFTPKLFFTDLYINHKLIGVGDEYNNRVILKKNLQYTSSLELEYDERNFSIGFVGLNFSAPQGCKYYYKLDGVDDGWVEVRDGNLVATYTNINDGEYAFRVKATNGDGVWSNEELLLNIAINPPLYRSTLAYIIYTLLGIALLVLVLWVVNLVMTKRREVFEAQLEQSKAEEVIQHKLEFFMNISHEFRTPLTLINIPLEKLMHNAKAHEDSSSQDNISEIKYNVNMLMSLINQLLDFRKIERGKAKIKPVCVDLSTFLNTYYEHFKPLAEHNNVVYTYDDCAAKIVSAIDVEMFEKVIINILSNAFKYTSAGDSIHLSLYQDSERGMAVISVKDSGRGVPKEEIPQLFDRFYQGQNRVYTANGNKGSGIGLSLCKGAVEMHHGNILINSDINQGFECIVEIPLSTDAECIEFSEESIVSAECISIVEDMIYDSSRVSSISRSSERRGTLLLVEDNEHLRTQLSKQLQDDYDVIVAEDGAHGFAMCLEHKPTIVVTDIMMPKMNGVEMCRQIKSCEEISHTPIMVLSGDTTVKNQIDSFTIGGADGYLEKPFSIELFKSKVETILNNRELLKRRFNQESIINPESIAKTPTDQKCISKVIGIVKKNLNNSELSIEYIAQEYGVSRTYLNRKIKAITGETSTQFIRNIRLKYAAKLILQKSMTVSEVAWAVGYNDVNSFRTRFKEMFGVLPTAYNGEPAIVGKFELDDELLV